LSGVTDVLTGEPAGNDVDSPIITLWREGSHVVPSSDVGPVFFKDSGCVFIDFHLPLTNHSGAFKPKVEPANSCE
jgi:hypothetical protein